jgi:glycosyltransferase involved in cell wall biosynthesis
MPRRLTIIIPVYNEAATVAVLLQKVIDLPLPDIEKEILVVESNSTDGTRDVVRSLEAQGRVQAIYEEYPQGKGHAVKTGLARATGEWILIQDADLEYDVNDYPSLLKPLQQGTTAFVLGSRHLGQQDWRYRRTGAGRWLGPLIDLGVWAYTQFFNLLYGTSLTDPCTMFKVFRRDCLNGIILLSNGFELDWEIVAKLVRKGFRPLEIPVTYRSRNFKDGKKVRIWRDGWRAMYAILRFRRGPLS